MKLKIYTAIIWTLCFIVAICKASIGEVPTWGMVFFPLIILTINTWIEVIEKILEGFEE